MTTSLDRFINRLRKKTKEVLKLHEKILDNYITYIKFYSTNLHWPIKPLKEILEIYRELYDMHQELIRDIRKLLPDVGYLTRRPYDLHKIYYDLHRKVRNMQNVHEELIAMQNHMLDAIQEKLQEDE
jgi:hypothetical protein